jgi:hypothetical protein
MYASKVRLSTVAQSRSRLSSVTFSCGSSTVRVSLDAVALLRAMRSPSMNRGPRSGKFRAGSNGFHLQTVNGGERILVISDSPEVVEVI